MANKIAFITEVSHLMAVLSSTLAISMVASVKRALGKTNAHQHKLKDIFFQSCKIAIVAMLEIPKRQGPDEDANTY